MKKLLTLFIALTTAAAMADTPPPGIVKIKGATDSTQIGNVSDSLKVDVTNTIPVVIPTPVPVVAATPLPVAQSGTWTVQQGTPPWSVSRTWTNSHSTDSIASWLFDSTGSGITSLAGSLNVNVTDFPSVQAVSQSGTWTTGRTWTTSHSTDSIVSWLADGAGNTLSSTGGSLNSNITNFPATTTVVQPTGTNLHVTVDNTIPVTVPTPLPVTGTVTANIGTTGGIALDTSIQSFLGSSTGGIPATKSTLFGGIYNSSLPTLSSGQQSAVQLDSSGRLIIRPLTSADVVTSNQGGTWTTGRTWTTAYTTDSMKDYLFDGTGNAIGSTAGSLNVNLTNSPTVTVTGVSTAANQTNGLQKSQVVDGANATVGPVQTVGGTNYMPVTLASSGTAGAAVPSKSVQMAGSDGTNLRTVSTDTSGNVNVNVVSSSNAQGAVTTAAPTYTTGTNNALSLKTTGDLRTDSSIADGYLSTIATNTGAQAQDFTQTGTISGLNGTVSITGQGVYTVTASVSGTWVGTLVMEGQTADSNWITLPFYQVSTTTPYPTITSATANGVYAFTGGGYLNVRVRASAYTSGTINVALDGSLSQQTVFAAQLGQYQNNVAGANFMTVTGTGTAVNTFAIPATDVGLYRDISLQIVITGTNTTTFQASNDNSNWFSTTCVTVASGVTVPAQTTAANGLFHCPVAYRYFRAQITAFTSGSSTGTAIISTQAPANDLGERTVSAVQSGSYATTLTSGTLSSQVVTTDIASAARTTTFTSASITPSTGSMSEAYQLDVTAVSGTNPTMDCTVYESGDSGTNFSAVYGFERVTTTGQFQIPMHRINGNRLQYSCVIAGTTPSFTFTLFRVDGQISSQQHHRYFDRNMVANTLGSTTSTYNIDGCDELTYGVSNASSSSAATFDVQLSEDGTNFENQATTVSPASGATQSIQALNVASKFARLIVTNAGTSETLNYSWLRCVGP
jgi:hypothetical protein